MVVNEQVHGQVTPDRAVAVVAEIMSSEVEQ
jgi:hypothetical protein